MRNSFNLLLIALICMDSCFLITSFLDCFRKGFNMITYVHYMMFPYFLFPFMSIAVTGSIFMTVAIAFERYWAVHYPIDYSQAINSPEACKKRLFKYVVPVLSFSIAVNLPKFFEAYVETEKHEILPDGYELWPDNTVTFNGTILENFSEEDLEYEYHYRIEVTDLRKNPYYTIYYTNWTRFFIMGIIPTVLLIYFNYKIYKDVKHRNRRQLSMSRTSATATQQARRKQEDNLAVVFMGIVLIFLVCNFPRNMLSLFESLWIRRSMACQNNGMHGFPVWAIVTGSFSHLLLVVNSSTNMILYIFLNKQFRMHFMNLVKKIVDCICGPCRRSANNNDTAAIPLEPIANGHGATAAGADTAPARQAGQQAQPLLPQSDTKKPEVLENGLCEVKIEAAKNEVAVESEAVVTPVVTASVVDKNGQQSVTTTQKDLKSPANDAVDV
eukprot:09090.XXX_64533_60387_1 [CDS] Oithona nana genome sequencing.